MLAVPPAILDLLHLGAGATVGMTVSDGRLLVEPAGRPRYTLDELLAQCDPAVPPSAEDALWISLPHAGREI